MPFHTNQFELGKRHWNPKTSPVVVEFLPPYNNNNNNNKIVRLTCNASPGRTILMHGISLLRRCYIFSDEIFFNFIVHFVIIISQVRGWIVDVIVSQPTFVRRKAVLSCIFRLCQTCANIGCFSAVAEILAGLR